MNSCTDKTEKGAETESRQAERLVHLIDQAIDNGRYTQAIELIDTLNIKFPKQLAARKTTLLSRAKAMEGLIRDSIPMTDSVIAKTEIAIKALAPSFETVTEPGFQPYKIERNVKNFNPAVRPSIQPRIGNGAISEGWSIMIGYPGASELKSIKAFVGSTEIPLLPPGSVHRVIQGSGYTALSLNAKEIDNLGREIESNPQEKPYIEIYTSGGTLTVQLTPSQAQAIVKTCQYAKAIYDNQQARIRRELLERKLIVAENQVANFTE